MTLFSICEICLSGCAKDRRISSRATRVGRSGWKTRVRRITEGDHSPRYFSTAATWQSSRNCEVQKIRKSWWNRHCCPRRMRSVGLTGCAGSERRNAYVESARDSRTFFFFLFSFSPFPVPSFSSLGLLFILFYFILFFVQKSVEHEVIELVGESTLIIVRSTEQSGRVREMIAGGGKIVKPPRGLGPTVSYGWEVRGL